jgi:hypothetical protein
MRLDAGMLQGPRPAGRERALVESDDPALAISDFRLFDEAGIDVVLCPGPDAGTPCPVLSGEDCALLSQVDVVLHELRAHPDIVSAICRLHPDLPVIVAGEAADETSLPAGARAVPVACSVDGQADAIHRAAARHSRSTP